MGLLLCFLGICIIIGIIGFLVDDRDFASGLVGFLVPAGLFTIVTIAILGTSYSNYVSLKAKYDGVVSQYKQAVTLYTDRAVLSTEIAFTDFKYQGYQENMGKLISDLRTQVAEYNQSYFEKQTMHKSWFFRLLIFEPDPDMKPLEIISENVKGKKPA